MGLHPSLKRAEKMTKTRSVMKRTERIKWLIERGAWKKGDRVFALPKIKVVKVKAIKKEKPKEEVKPEAATALGAPQEAQTKTQTQSTKPAPQG